MKKLDQKKNMQKISFTQNLILYGYLLVFQNKNYSLTSFRKSILLNLILVGVGGVFEWVAGTKIKAPEFIANLGLEWILRLAQEPKRLFRRYLIDNILLFLYLITKQYISKK